MLVIHYHHGSAIKIAWADHTLRHRRVRSLTVDHYNGNVISRQAGIRQTFLVINKLNKCVKKRFLHAALFIALVILWYTGKSFRNIHHEQHISLNKTNALSMLDANTYSTTYFKMQLFLDHCLCFDETVLNLLKYRYVKYRDIIDKTR